MHEISPGKILKPQTFTCSGFYDAWHCKAANKACNKTANHRKDVPCEGGQHKSVLLLEAYIFHKDCTSWSARNLLRMGRYNFNIKETPFRVQCKSRDNTLLPPVQECALAGRSRRGAVMSEGA